MHQCHTYHFKTHQNTSSKVIPKELWKMSHAHPIPFEKAIYQLFSAHGMPSCQQYLLKFGAWENQSSGSNNGKSICFQCWSINLCHSNFASSTNNSKLNPAFCLFLLVDVSDVVKHCARSNKELLKQQKMKAPDIGQSFHHWGQVTSGSVNVYVWSTWEICLVLRSPKTLIAQIGYGMVLLLFQQPLVYRRCWSLFALQGFEHHTTTLKLHDIGTYRDAHDFMLAESFKWVSHLWGVFLTAKNLKWKKNKTQATARFTMIVKVNHLLLGKSHQRICNHQILVELC